MLHPWKKHAGGKSNQDAGGKSNQESGGEAPRMLVEKHPEMTQDGSNILVAMPPASWLLIHQHPGCYSTSILVSFPPASWLLFPPASLLLLHQHPGCYSRNSSQDAGGGTSHSFVHLFIRAAACGTCTCRSTCKLEHFLEQTGALANTNAGGWQVITLALQVCLHN